MGNKTCPPGVICVENVTLTIFIIISVIIIYLAYKHYASNNKSENRLILGVNDNVNNNYMDLQVRSNYGYETGRKDVLLNPYIPPLKDSTYFNGDIRGGIPINIPTRSVDARYRQVGILTRVNGQETILSLMGRPLFPSQDKWQFYTMSDKNQSVKLPVTHKKRSCTSDLGCDNIYNGDTVYVEGYNDAFKATIYDNQLQYSLPYI